VGLWVDGEQCTPGQAGLGVGSLGGVVESEERGGYRESRAVLTALETRAASGKRVLYEGQSEGQDEDKEIASRIVGKAATAFLDMKSSPETNRRLKKLWSRIRFNDRFCRVR